MIIFNCSIKVGGIPVHQKSVTSAWRSKFYFRQPLLLFILLILSKIKRVLNFYCSFRSAPGSFRARSLAAARHFCSSRPAQTSDAISTQKKVRLENFDFFGRKFDNSRDFLRWKKFEIIWRNERKMHFKMRTENFK